MQPVRLSFVFYDIKSKIFSHRHSCNVYDLYAGVVPQMLPPPHDLERLRTTMVDFIVIFNRGRRVVSWTLYGLGISSRSTGRPLNGHPPSKLLTG